MIREQINGLIMQAMKDKAPEYEVNALKEIKAKFLNYSKSSEGVKNPLDDTLEVVLIQKLVKEHQEALSFLSSDSAEAENEKKTIELLEKYLPAEATPEEISEFAKTIVEPGNKKGMGGYIKEIKAKYPTADGKTISEIVKTLIG